MSIMKNLKRLLKIEDHCENGEKDFQMESPLLIDSKCSHKQLKTTPFLRILKKCQICKRFRFKITKQCLDCKIIIHKKCRSLLPLVSKEDDVLTRSSSVDEVITTGKDSNEIVLSDKTANPTNLISPHSAILPTIDNTYKYWKIRRNIFDRFDNGILLDEESFCSIFPEIIIKHIANQCVGMKKVIEPFCGAVGNIIQLAKVCDSVIAIDIDPAKIQLAKNNAKVYNIYHKITFIFKIAHRLQPADCIVTSPPWGGPTYDRLSLLSPKSILVNNILELGIKLTPKILLHMPKNLNTNECILIGKRHRVRTFKKEIININCHQNSKLLYFNSLKNDGNDHTNYTMVNFDRYCNLKINEDCRQAITKKPIKVMVEDEVVKGNKLANPTKSFSPNTVTLSTIDNTYKYWKIRRNIFDRFDDGILLDEESFCKVYPETIRKHIANQCMGMKVVVDPFCGAGGNVIQLARVCDSVIAIDIDPAKIQLAKNNAKVYNVYNKITFIIADFFEIAHRLQLIDCIVTSLSPKDILVDKILDLGIKLAPKILLHMPKNLNTNECILIGKRHRVRTFKEEVIKINYHQNSKLLYFNSLKDNGKEHTNYSTINFNQRVYFDINNSKEMYHNYLKKVGHFLSPFRKNQRGAWNSSYYS